MSSPLSSVRERQADSEIPITGYEVLGLSYQPSGHPSQTHPPQADVGETVPHSGAPNGEKAFDWSNEKRLGAVFIVPGLIARESGLAIPKVRLTKVVARDEKGLNGC